MRRKSLFAVDILVVPWALPNRSEAAAMCFRIGIKKKLINTGRTFCVPG